MKVGGFSLHFFEASDQSNATFRAFFLLESFHLEESGVEETPMKRVEGMFV